MYITYLVKRNITSASDPQNFTTGSALAPMAEQAAPKRKAKTTICSASLRAMASTMLVGTMFSSLKPLCAAGRAVSAAVAVIGTPAPGRTRFTAPSPRKSASVVTTSK
jgi:hypothetical protein